MASVYKGLTIEIGADTSKLDRALNTARRSARQASREVSDLERALKLDPGNTKLVARQQEELKLQIKATERELEALKKAEEQIGKEKMSTEQWTHLQTDIALAESRLEEYTRRLREMETAQAAANSALGRAGAKVTELGEKLEPVGEKMSKLGTGLTMGVTMPIVAGAGAAVKAATDIDTSLTNVKKTVDGTAEDYQALHDAALEYSKVNAVSASEILDIEALGAQLGFTLEKFENGKSQVQEFGEVVSGLDIATNMSAEQAGTELAQFFNIMREGKEQASNYGSTIVGLGNSFATTESDISAMAMRIAGAGKSIGLSSADVLGMAAALTSLGIEAEAGGTAISTIMSGIDASAAVANENTSKWAREMGMSISEFSRAMRSGGEEAERLAAAVGMSQEEIIDYMESGGDAVSDWAATAGMDAVEFAALWSDKPVEAFSAVMQGMHGAVEEGGNLSIILSELGIDSVRQTDMMKRLANSGDFMSRAVAKANEEWSENSALTNEVANRNASMAAKFEMLKNRVTAVATEVGEPLADALFELLDAAEPLFEAIENGARAFADMSDEEQQQVIQTVALIAALGPALALFGKVTRSVTVVGGAMTKMSKLLARAKTGFVALRSDMAYTGQQARLLQAESAKTGTRMSAMGARARVAGAGLKTAATSAKVAGAAMKAATSVGIMLAITAIVELVGWLNELNEKQKTAAKATDGLRDAVGTLGNKTSAGVRGLEAVGGAADNYRDKVERCIEKQAELAESIASDFGEVNQNAGALDYWAQKIAELAGNVGNSPEKLAELKVALGQYNEIAGTSYSITDETSGALDISTAAILRNAEAWELNAYKQAMAEKQTELIKQQIDNEMALEEATNAYTTALEAAEAEQAGLGYITQGTIQKVADAEKVMNEAKAAVDASADAQEKLSQKTSDYQKQLDALANVAQAAADTGSEAVQRFAEGLDAGQAEAVQAAASVSQRTVGELLTAASDAGLAGDAQIKAYVEAVQAGDDPAAAAAKAAAVAANQALEETSDGTPAGAKESQTYAAGIDPHAGDASAAAMGGNAVSAAAGASDATVVGGILSSTAPQGINVQAMNPKSTSLVTTAISAAKTVDASGIGRFFSEGAASGIAVDAMRSKAVEMANNAVAAMKAALGIASPSKEAMRLGRYFSQGAALGIEGSIPEVERAASDMAAAAMRSAEMSAPNLGASYNASASARQMARTMAAEGAGGMTVLFEGTRVNDSEAIQGAVLTIIDAARVSAVARRRS